MKSAYTDIINRERDVAWNAALEAAAKTADAHLLIDWLDKASPEVDGAKRMQVAISKAIRNMKREA